MEKYVFISENDQILGIADGGAYYEMEGARTEWVDIPDEIAIKFNEGYVITIDDKNQFIAEETEQVIENKEDQEWILEMKKKAEDGLLTEKEIQDCLAHLL